MSGIVPRWLTPVDRRNIATAAGIAIVIRAALIISYSPLLSSDSGDYLGLARRIAAWNFDGWQARRTPTYPLLLLAVHYSPSAIWIVQAVLGVVSTMMVYLVIRSLGAGSAAALAGAIVYGASLEVVAVERVVLTEAVTSFLMLSAALICVRMIRSGSGRTPRGLLAEAAIVLLLLCLTRPDASAAAVVLAVATAVALASGTYSRRRPAKARRVALTSAILIGPAVAGLVAWASFNAATAGTFTVSSVIGYNMIDHVGSYVVPEPGPDEAITAAYAYQYRRSRGAGFPSYAALPEIERHTGLDPAKLSGRYLRIALQIAITHPVAYINSSMKQFAHAFRQPNYADSFSSGPFGAITRLVWSVERVLQLLISSFFLVLCVVGAFLSVRRSRRLDAATVILAATALIGTFMAAFVGYTDPGRYAYPYFPFVICVSFAAAKPAFEAVRGWHRTSDEAYHASQ
jgi:hypothetical protein